MNVPFYDLLREHKKYYKEIDAALKKTIKSSHFILGKQEKLFEEEFAQYIGGKFAIGVGNGTEALIIALKALGVKEGDEVIIPAFTFVATGFAVTLAGAKPVLVDVDSRTHAIDPERITSAITKKTKAIIVVHLYGLIGEFDKVKKIAKKHKLFIVEDAAQAHGAMYSGKNAGALGDISTFSFYPAKNLGALGDGGAVVTDSKILAEKVLLLRNYGQQEKYFSTIVGTNSRLDEIHAAVLRVKLKHLEVLNGNRRKFAKYYKDNIKGLDVTFPDVVQSSVPAYHLFTIQVKNRNVVQKKMTKMGIETLIHYPIPVHLQEAYTELKYKKGDFPVSEKIAESTLSLPFSPFITKKELDYVIQSLKKVL